MKCPTEVFRDLGAARDAMVQYPVVPTQRVPDDTPTPVETASWDLVIAAQNGDRDAFGRLYGRYRDMVFRYVSWRIADRQLAEDLTADTFVRALRRIGSVTYQGRDIGAWLIRIARNLVLDHVKRSRTRLEYVGIGLNAKGDAPSAGHSFMWGARCPQVDDQAIRAETTTTLTRYLSWLTDRQQEVIRLRFTEQRSINDTAAHMGVSVAACKAMQRRAVVRLAQFAADDGYTCLAEFAGEAVAA